ncbi:MAG: hypothetical protein IPP32_04850 [Bacteroidetes bacterium]|nr:hypothetical protein [Bacteroidota bacterium]
MRSRTPLLLCVLIAFFASCKKSEDTVENNISNFKLLGFSSDAIISSPDKSFLLVNYNTGKIESINNEGDASWVKENCFHGFNPNKLSYLKNPVKFAFNETSELCVFESIKDTNNPTVPKHFMELSKYDKNGMLFLKKKVMLPNDLDSITLFDVIFVGQQTIVAFRQLNDLHFLNLNNTGVEIWHQVLFLSTNGVRLALLNATSFIVLRDQVPNLLIENRNLSDGALAFSTSYSRQIFNGDGSNPSESFALLDIQSQLLIGENSISFCGNRDHKINSSEIFSRIFMTRINTQSNSIKSNYMEEGSDIECLGGNLAIGADGKEKLIGLFEENSASFYPIQFNLEDVQGAAGCKITSAKIKDLTNCFPLALTVNDDGTLTIVGKKGTMPEYVPLPYVLKPKFYSQQTFLIRIKL